MIDYREVRDFLNRVWGVYVSGGYGEVRIKLPNGKIIRRFFKVDADVGDKVAEWLQSIEHKLAGAHIWFGVLPRSEKKGTADAVKQGMFLWLDRDFKQVFEKLDDVPIPDDVKKVASETGRWFEEGDDHALRGVYREGNKWVYVERPALSDDIKVVEQLTGLKPFLVVDSGCGYHYYFKLSEPVPAEKLKQLEERVVEVGNGDPQSRDLARVLRLPGTVNPRLGRLSKVIHVDFVEYGPSEVGTRLLKPSETVNKTVNVEATDELSELEKVVGGGEAEAEDAGFRRLSESHISKLIEICKRFYRPGYRQLSALYLAGAFAHAHIHPIDCARFLVRLAEETGDDELNERLSTVYYTYLKKFSETDEVKKALEEVDRYVEDLEKAGKLKKKVYKPRSISEAEKVASKKGLYEDVLKPQGYSEEEAVDIISKIQEVLKESLPFRDLFIVIMDYEKQEYAVVNFRRKFVVRARRKDNKLVFKDRIFNGVPTKVIEYVNPLGGPEKFEIVWEFDRRPPLRIGPALLPDVLARLRLAAAVEKKSVAEDVLSAIINAFIRTGRGELRIEIDSPGFYMVEGRVTKVRVDWLEEPSTDELREALEFLNELAEQWFQHAQAKFATVVKWGIAAPFSYIYKQRGVWMPWLYLYGASKTGKTTLGEIVLSIWGLGTKHMKSGTNIDTVPRFGAVVSQSTFPVLINEPGGAIRKDDIKEAIKNAVENVVARGKHLYGGYVEIPALAPLIFASNKVVPTDDALLRRLIVITFTPRERIPEDRAETFLKTVKPRFEKLKALGAFIAKLVEEEPELLKLDWRDFAVEVLKRAYETVNMEVPKWIELEHREKEDAIDILIEQVRVALLEDILNYTSKFVKTSNNFVPSMIQELLEIGALPWAILKNDNVYITRSVINVLEKKGIEVPGGLKGLAELLGWEYRYAKIGRRSTRVVVCSLNEFIDFLSPEPEEGSGEEGGE